MKFPILILFVLLLSSATAQTLLPRLGITGSTNSQYTYKTSVNPGVGFTVGLGYNQQLTEKFSLQLELNYIQKAFSTDYAQRFSQNVGTDTYFVDEKIKTYYRLPYLEVPLLLKVKFNKFFLNAGPYAAYGLGGSYHYTLDRTSSYLDPVHESGSSDIKFGKSSAIGGNDVYLDNQWDLGFQAGLGILLFEKLLVECRYSRGSNLRDSGDSRNQSIQLTFSTSVNLKKAN